jgi:hypothetical protein
MQAARGKLVKIRMPGSDQRNAQDVREVRAQLAEFSWANDVNQIGSKIQERTPHGLLVTPKEQVVAQVALDSKTRPTARELHVSHTALFKLGEL